MNDLELILFWEVAFLTYYKIALEQDAKTPGIEIIAAARATEAVKELKSRMAKTDIFVLKPNTNSRVIGHVP